MQASGALSDVSSRSITYPPVEVRAGSTAGPMESCGNSVPSPRPDKSHPQARARSAPIPSPSRQRHRPPESVNVCDVDLCPEMGRACMRHVRRAPQCRLACPAPVVRTCLTGTVRGEPAPAPTFLLLPAAALAPRCECLPAPMLQLPVTQQSHTASPSLLTRHRSCSPRR